MVKWQWLREVLLNAGFPPTVDRVREYARLSGRDVLLVLTHPNFFNTQLQNHKLVGGNRNRQIILKNTKK
jgi:hypothetical protein